MIGFGVAGRVRRRARALADPEGPGADLALVRRGWRSGCRSLAVLGNSAGWIFTEMGRQPWVVFGLMTTEERRLARRQHHRGLDLDPLAHAPVRRPRGDRDRAAGPLRQAGRRPVRGAAGPDAARQRRRGPTHWPSPTERRSDMELTTVWFILIAVLWIGYFCLEGFDFGVGMLLPVLARDDRERRIMINTIGPVWDGNEVWVLTAGGATFAAFPEWYATLFSGFYLPLLLILLAPDRARPRVRVPPPAARGRLGTPGGTARSFVGSVRARDPVGRRVRQHRPRRADRRRQGLHRQPVHAAQPVRAARRAGDAAAVPHPRRDVPGAQDRRRHPAPGPGAQRPVRPGGRGGRGGVPGLDPGRSPATSARRCCSCSPRSRCVGGVGDGGRAAGRAGRSSAPSSTIALAVAGLFVALFPDVMPSTHVRGVLADDHERVGHRLHAEGDDLGRGDLHAGRARATRAGRTGCSAGGSRCTTSPSTRTLATREADRPASYAASWRRPAASWPWCWSPGSSAACCWSARRGRSPRWCSRRCDDGDLTGPAAAVVAVFVGRGPRSAGSVTSRRPGPPCVVGTDVRRRVVARRAARRRAAGSTGELAGAGHPRRRPPPSPT